MKIAILNSNKEIAKLNEKVIKLKTFAIFITQSVSAFLGAEQAKEFIKIYRGGHDMIFTCKKCGSTNYRIETKGTQNGLYCSQCGFWHKWD